MSRIPSVPRSLSRSLGLSALALSGVFALTTVVLPEPAFAQKKGAKKEDPKKKKGDDKKKADDKKSGSDRPGDSQATTKGLEETLKKTSEPVDERRLAPAKLDTPPSKEVT